MAAVGDMFADIDSIAGDAYLDIRPAAGHEAVIHNIYHADAIELYRYDGVNEILIDSVAGGGCYAFYAFHVGNTERIRVKNKGGVAELLGYDGIYTKVP